METKKFTYGNLYKFNRVVLFLFSLILFIVGLVYLWGLMSLLVGQETKLSLSVSQLFWYFIGCSVWTPFVYAFLSYLATDIVAQEDGLQIKFIFKTLFISWEDIAEFRPAKVFGFRMIKNASIVVTRSALTPFHRLYGLMYGKTNQPSLLIWPYLGNYENLVTIIKENLKRSRLLARQKTIQNSARTKKTDHHKSVPKN